MKKWQKISLGVFIVIAYMTYLGLKEFKIFKIRSRGAEGKLHAAGLKMYLDNHHKEHGSFPDIQKLRKDAAEFSSFQRYRFGITGEDEVSSFCEDCVLTKDKYKVAIYGNIDDDPESDVIYIENNRRGYQHAQKDL